MVYNLPNTEELAQQGMERLRYERLAQNHLDVGGVTLSLHRTVRVPEGKMNSLPASLGTFPIYKVSDFKDSAPEEWREDGYFIPMYAQEAMWINFSGSQPRALVVGAGNINAITGKPFDPSKAKKRRFGKKAEAGLDIKLEDPQNYVVTPTQPWIDGWKAEDGKVYQFVAAELGSGQTVEGQITGEETVGGIQLIAYAPNKPLPVAHRPPEYISSGGWGGDAFLESAALSFGGGAMRSMSASPSKSIASMGLGRGGKIRQKIYPDPYGTGVWRAEPEAVEKLYIVSSRDFKQITGFDAPATPINRATYEGRGLPWFDLWDGDRADASGSGVFDKLKPVDDDGDGEPAVQSPLPIEQIPIKKPIKPLSGFALLRKLE